MPGGVYGWPKNALHWAGINESIADLHSLFPRQSAIVDGIVAMEGNGPIRGVPKPTGALVADRDPAAVDATCCRIMGIDPFRVDYLRLASSEQAHMSEVYIRQVGESIDTIAKPFALPPGFDGLRI